MTTTSLPDDRRSRLAWRAALALTLISTGCGETTPPGAGAGGAPTADSVTIMIDGSSTVYPISREGALAYKKVNPDVNVIVNKSGTGGGFGKYLDDKLDIVDASRPAKPEEESKAKANGLDWERFLIGYDGITVVTNRKVDFIKELSFAQLKKIWEKESTVKNWSDVDPSWPARPISFHTPDEDSGTYDYFTEAIGTHKKQRGDAQPSADDNKLVRGVVGDDDGMGYFGYAYFEANARNLRAVPIRKKDDGEAIAPKPAAILDGSYPLARPLFLYVKKTSLRKPEVNAFVKFYVDNAKKLATSARYVAPTDADDVANKKLLHP